MPNNPYSAQIDELIHQIAVNQELLDDPDLAELAAQEVADLTAQRQMLETAAAEYESNTSGGVKEEPGLTKHVNCIIEIRQGAGGDEANIWGNDLLRMYLRFAEIIGIKVEFLDELVIKCKGRTSAISFENDETGALLPATAYDIFKYESGVHRVQRVPATEAQGRIHTSTASVAVLPEVHPQAVEIRDEDLDWQFTRSGGAGGQNVNKVNSAVRLTHIPTGVVATSRQERSQGQNREVALGLLRSQLWEIQEEARLKELGQARSAIGRAQRAEKIRTYNYAQNRVTDHRINQSWYDLEQIMEGRIEDMIKAVHMGLDQPNSDSAPAGDSSVD